MTIGSWNPNDKESAVNDTVDTELLARFLTAANSIPCDLKAVLSDEDLQQTRIIDASLSAWQLATNDFSNEEIITLLQFFTLVEVQVPSWIAGVKSPAIKINKILRKRGSKLNKETLLWIRNNTENRFIPNGSPL